MKLKFFLLPIFILISLLYVSYKLFTYLTKIEVVGFSTASQNNVINPIGGKKILIINTQKKFGGGEVYTLSLYKNLIKNGFDTKILVLKNSWLENELINEKLPYFTCRTFAIRFKENLYQICKNHQFDLIHCNVDREAYAAKYVATYLPVCTVLSKHIPNKFKREILENLDGVIAISSQISDQLKDQNKKEHLNITHIDTIAPFFEEDKFRNFKTNEIKNEFFHKNFGFTLKDLPLVCNVTNMSRDKNPHLLVKATAILIHEKNKPIEVVFVGSGNQESRVQALAKQLNVENYVHFLGHSRKVPAILNYCNILVNTSKQEGFGIVLLEAASMKKSLVGPQNTGVADVILDNQTGILFNNDDEQDLAKALEYLIDNPQNQMQLGLNAYNFVQKNFSTSCLVDKLEEFYKKVLFSKKHAKIKSL